MTLDSIHVNMYNYSACHDPCNCASIVPSAGFITREIINNEHA